MILVLVHDDLEQPESFGIEFVGMLAQQHSGEAFNGPDRGLEVMGHGIGKGFQLLVAGLQLGGPLFHPPLQLLLLDDKLVQLGR